MTHASTEGGPINVAVIGGGCASMAAAFELTRPEHGGKYQVTVYQLGWRLGGKGASGRGAADRIEEHGLHLWMGFYENAFRLMRECYAEARRDPRTCRMADWRDAFHPDPGNAVADKSPMGGWMPWKVNFPPLPGLPGDPGAPRPWTAADYVARTLTLLRTLLESIEARAGAQPTTGDLRAGTARPAEVTDRIARMLKLGQLATLGALLEALRLMQTAVAAFSQYPEGLLLDFHDAIASSVRAQLESLVERDDELRRLWAIVDITLAVVRGAIRFQLMTDPRGFDAIDDHECREWLCLNGASKRSVSGAATRALYDLAFAYEDGDVGRPRIAAGAALRGSLRAFFTYRGSFFWKMQSGMGDVVFAPLWEVLVKRGVRFEFFHRLEDVGIREAEGDEHPHVHELTFDIQARTKKSEYRPLVDVRGLPCWPARPDWAQLEDGARLEREGVDFESHWDRTIVEKKTLRVGIDFDMVVLGIGIGAVPHTCKQILARDARWRDMVAHVKTVPTQALQVWMREDMSALGWTHGPINISGFVEPFDTWADMSHLVREESHAQEVRSIAYFCSVLPDAGSGGQGVPGYPAARAAEVKENAVHFLDHEIASLWPKAAGPDGFRWDVLVGAGPTEAGPPGAARIDGQYWRANVSPTDRYALSLPGTVRYRISPLDATYDNLTIAGDWTECSLNQGCVEAAVMSGRLAAHAISKSPPLEDIVGYDHP